VSFQGRNKTKTKKQADKHEQKKQEQQNKVTKEERKKKRRRMKINTETFTSFFLPVLITRTNKK